MPATQSHLRRCETVSNGAPTLWNTTFLRIEGSYGMSLTASGEGNRTDTDARHGCG